MADITTNTDATNAQNKEFNEKSENPNTHRENGDSSGKQSPELDLSKEKTKDSKGNGHLSPIGTHDKIEITELDCYEELGYCWPTWKKWGVLTVIFIVQISMNFNTSLYSNALGGISRDFNVSAQAARCGAMIFLVLYAFGCELWAPWSEEFGRWPVLQLSLFLVNIWNLPVALAPNFASIMVGRALGGLSSAGGSVTLGMIADLWESDKQQYAVAYVVFSSVFGSVLGPIVGGFVEQYLAWQWAIWIQLIFGFAIQFVHFWTPETRTTKMMDKIAKDRRKAFADGQAPDPIWAHQYGPNEMNSIRDRMDVKEILVTWVRPFRMFLTEPIVLTLSLLSGFSDALIFIFIQSFAIVYGEGIDPVTGKGGWGFSSYQVGLAFLSIGIGYVIAWLLFIPAIRRNVAERKANPYDEKAQYESRLWFLLYTAPCLPIGLIIFAWTSTGPPLHWIGSMIAAAIVGIANYSIYMATIDYMICAYGPYSASATGGNGWSRDFLAGVLTIPATPFYENVGKAYASTILFCISFVLVIAVYAIYFYGPVLRKRSPFAQKLADQAIQTSTDNSAGGRRLSYISHASGRRASIEMGMGGGGARNRSLGGAASRGGSVAGQGGEGEEGMRPTILNMGGRRGSASRMEQEERVRVLTGSRRNSYVSGGKTPKGGRTPRGGTPRGGSPVRGAPS